MYFYIPVYMCKHFYVSVYFYVIIFLYNYIHTLVHRYTTEIAYDICESVYVVIILENDVVRTLNV